MVFIYVLRCEDNKYYIGKTTNSRFYIEDYTASKGSQWTFKYKPLQIEQFYSGCSDSDEDRYVKIYMAKYGIQNVRGGNYSQVVLDDSIIASLEKELNIKNTSTLRSNNLLSAAPIVINYGSIARRFKRPQAIVSSSKIFALNSMSLRPNIPVSFNNSIKSNASDTLISNVIESLESSIKDSNVIESLESSVKESITNDLSNQVCCNTIDPTKDPLILDAINVIKKFDDSDESDKSVPVPNQSDKKDFNTIISSMNSSIDTVQAAKSPVNSPKQMPQKLSRDKIASVQPVPSVQSNTQSNNPRPKSQNMAQLKSKFEGSNIIMGNPNYTPKNNKDNKSDNPVKSDKSDKSNLSSLYASKINVGKQAHSRPRSETNPSKPIASKEKSEPVKPIASKEKSEPVKPMVLKSDTDALDKSTIGTPEANLTKRNILKPSSADKLVISSPELVSKSSITKPKGSVRFTKSLESLTDEKVKQIDIAVVNDMKYKYKSFNESGTQSKTIHITGICDGDELLFKRIYSRKSKEFFNLKQEKITRVKIINNRPNGSNGTWKAKFQDHYLNLSFKPKILKDMSFTVEYYGYK